MEEKHAVSQVRPWVRFFARSIDYSIFNLIFIIIAPSLISLWIFLFIVTTFIWIFIESGLLCSWGTTPGKWLLKTTVRDSTDQKLSFSNAFNRSFSVWLRGMAIGFPIATFIANIIAYGKLTKDSVTTWDQKGGFKVSHEKIGTLRVIITISLYIIIFLLRRWILSQIRFVP